MYSQGVTAFNRLSLLWIQAGLTAVLCWVKEMTDEQAFMELVLCNTQSELHPLEEGKHAAESGMDLKAYAEASGKVRQTLGFKVLAWRVLSSVLHVKHEEIKDSWRNLAEIHAAPNWIWTALVKKMVADGWTVQTTRDKTAAFKETGLNYETAKKYAVTCAIFASGRKAIRYRGAAS